jgi:predicted DNA-binding transcriptional regulator AlpA
MHNALINPSGFVRATGLRSLGVPYAVSTVWAKVAKGEFPAPVKLGPTVTAWKIADVLAWLDEQAIKHDVVDNNRGARLTAARQAKQGKGAA